MNPSPNPAVQGTPRDRVAPLTFIVERLLLAVTDDRNGHGADFRISFVISPQWVESTQSRNRLEDVRHPDFSELALLAVFGGLYQIGQLFFLRIIESVDVLLPAVAGVVGLNVLPAEWAIGIDIGLQFGD